MKMPTPTRRARRAAVAKTVFEIAGLQIEINGLADVRADRSAGRYSSRIRFVRT
jgi:hypothetical protein